MLAYGLKDPYTRFITPSEFQAMRKYDVTGVGLNLATAEEFSRKSGMSLPEDRSDVEVRPSAHFCKKCSRRSAWNQRHHCSDRPKNRDGPKNS